MGLARLSVTGITLGDSRGEKSIFTLFFSNMKQYSVGNIHVNFSGNPIHRSHTDWLYTHKLTGVCLYFLYNLFPMESLVSPTILRLEQWGLFHCVQNLSLQILWIAFLRFWNIMGNMRILLKIIEY